MIDIPIQHGGRSYRAIGGLGWINLTPLDPTPRAGPRPRTTRAPIRALRRAMQTRRARSGVCLEDAAEPSNWMFGHLHSAPKDSISALVWLAVSNPRERILYLQQQESGVTWLAASDQGRIALTPEVDALITGDQALRTAIDGLLEHWMSEDVPFRIVLNLRNRITTPMLERAVQRGLAGPGTLADLVSVPPPQAARIGRLLPLPLGNAIAMAALAGAGMWFISDWYIESRQRQQLMEQERRELLRDAGVELDADVLSERDLMAQEAAVLESLRVDTQTPVPQEVLIRCANLTASLIGSAPGWDLVTVDCHPDGSTATSRWHLPLGSGKPVGNNASLMTLAASVPNTSLQFQADYQTATAVHLLEPGSGRSALNRTELPVATELLRNLGARMQQLRTGIPGLMATIVAPQDKSVAYPIPVDPAVEQTAGPRIGQVASDRVYLEGRLLLGGQGVLELAGINLRESHLSLSKLTISPDGKSWNWNAELNYYCRR